MEKLPQARYFLLVLSQHNLAHKKSREVINIKQVQFMEFHLHFLLSHII